MLTHVWRSTCMSSLSLFFFYICFMSCYLSSPFFKKNIVLFCCYWGKTHHDLHRHRFACRQHFGSAARVFGRQICFGWASSKLDGLSFPRKIDLKENGTGAKLKEKQTNWGSQVHCRQHATIFKIPPEGKKIRRGSLYYIKMLTVGSWQDGFVRLQYINLCFRFLALCHWSAVKVIELAALWEAKLRLTFGCWLISGRLEETQWGPSLCCVWLLQASKI